MPLERTLADQPMPDFEVYVDDSRYAVPSLYLISAHSIARARAMAEEVWRGSEHHLGVELRHNGERVAALAAPAELVAAPGPSSAAYQDAYLRFRQLYLPIAAVLA